MSEVKSRKYAMISTYPPTPCGIATFAAALSDGLVEIGHEVGVIRLGATGESAGPLVEAELPARNDADRGDAEAALRRADVVVVQHEYGIFPGLDGESVLPILESTNQPTIVVAHTVLERPTLGQRMVLEEVVRLADAVVVMTEAARLRLCSGFDADPRKVFVIPHGAAVSTTTRRPRADGRPELLTWGLLGPGKGIEWAIDAMAQLSDLRPRPTYRVAGVTHPKVAATEGEAYREMLGRRVAHRGVGSQVHFDAAYRSVPALTRVIEESSIVVLPYDSPDQVTSGVLVDAIAAGRPVIATAFPHAIELLASGAGLVVPRRDPQALAAAIRRVLTEVSLAESMAREARRLALSLAWPSVAARYAEVGEMLLEQGSPVSV